jgi:hypothetical protein
MVMVRETAEGSLREYADDFLTVQINPVKLLEALNNKRFDDAHRLAREIEAAAAKVAESARERFVLHGGEPT